MVRHVAVTKCHSILPEIVLDELAGTSGNYVWCSLLWLLLGTLWRQFVLSRKGTASRTLETTTVEKFTESQLLIISEHFTCNQHLRQVTRYFLFPFLCHCQRHNRERNYTLHQPYPNKDNGVTSSVPVVPVWQWMMAFQWVFPSNTVASVRTWENEWQVSVIISRKERDAMKRKLTSHPSTSVVSPFCVQISGPPKFYDYLW